MLSAAEYVAKWKAGATGAKYSQGIRNTTVNPMELAAQQADRMLAGVNEAVQSGRWAQNLRAVSQDQWKQAAAGKGAQNYVTGVNAADAKMAAVAPALLQTAQQAKDAIRAMPKGPKGGAESMARVQRNMEIFIAFKNSRGRR